MHILHHVLEGAKSFIRWNWSLPDSGILKSAKAKAADRQKVGPTRHNRHHRSSSRVHMTKSMHMRDEVEEVKVEWSAHVDAGTKAVVEKNILRAISSRGVKSRHRAEVDQGVVVVVLFSEDNHSTGRRGAKVIKGKSYVALARIDGSRIVDYWDNPRFYYSLPQGKEFRLLRDGPLPIDVDTAKIIYGAEWMVGKNPAKLAKFHYSERTPRDLRSDTFVTPIWEKPLREAQRDHRIASRDQRRTRR